MKSLLLILFFAASSTFAQVVKVNFCHQSLADTTNLTFTEIFFAYLSELHKGRVVTDLSIETLKSDLEQQPTLKNPVTNKTSSDYKIHLDSVQDYLNNDQLDRSNLLKLLTQFLNEQSETRRSKKQSREKTRIAARVIELHPIEKGSFTEMRFESMGQGASQVVGLKEYQTEVPHSFMMMDSKVTRYYWKKVYPNTVVTQATADLPMVKISALSAMAYANELSKREGLKPVYILKPEVLDPNTKAEDGTLSLLESVELPPSAFIDAPSGDIYQTEGYRLPTQDEQFFVRTQRGQVKNTQFFPGVTSPNLSSYAWLKQNTDELQTTGSLLPFVIDGNNFYDLYGNATEFTHPNEYPMDVFTASLFGTSFKNSRADVLDLTFITSSFNLTSSGDDISFRLVRTLHPKKQP